MPDIREIVENLALHMANGDYEKVFSQIGDNGTYTIIGKTKLSRTYRGQQEVKNTFLPNGKSNLPRVRCSAPIVDGNRAALFGSGEAVEMRFGTYQQPHYAFSVDLHDDASVHIVEYLDTVTIETSVLGNKLVDGRVWKALQEKQQTASLA
jgi:ketosteroid isomerase-like protein